MIVVGPPSGLSTRRLPSLVAGFLPGNLGHQVREYLPENTASDVTTMTHQAGTPGPWAGFALFCLYTAVTLGASAWLLRRRDA
jgi:ABC-2 type transport system permease protein